MSTWQIDPAHTNVAFSAKHMMVTSVRGRFTQVEGQLELDEARPEHSRGEIRVAAASLTTDVEQRDHHLRSPDFLDVDRYPTIIGRVSGIRAPGEPYVVTVELTIRDVTRAVELDAEYLGIFQGLRGGRRIGFRLTGRLARKDWGLTWNMALEAGGWLVGEEVLLEVEVAADETPG